MIRIPVIPAHGLWPLLAGAVLVSAAFAEEAAQDSAAKPAATPAKTIFDVVSGFFGESTPDHAKAVPPAASPDVQDAVEASSEERPTKARDLKIKIQKDYSTAVREAQLNNRPLLVVLGARWCSWCRKLEAELETAEAESILSEWIVVEVDVDDEPEVAGKMEASALPGLRILGPFQAVVASREGYLEIGELKQWLAENRKSADPAVYKVLYDTAEPDEAAINQLIAMLAEPSPMLRVAASERLAAHRRVSAGPLVQILKTGRLAQQLSACEVLRKWHAPIGEIDPWRPDTLRADQFVLLVAWSRQQMDAESSNAEPNSQPVSAQEFDAQSADDLLQRLIKSESGQRASLLAQLVGMGTPLAVEVRSRLARDDAVDDATRESLRELLYHLLASRKLRLEQPGILTALARLDSESHRQAAVVILDKATIVDQPLVDELARDADPLIRELAVRALGRVGLFNDNARIQQLLTDVSPNVRTAVLRVLTEHPSDESVESLCEYLSHETDEDLLVHGAKCLAQLPRQPKALAALARLAANPSWRVRATAIEAAGQAIELNSQQPTPFSGGANKGGLPQELADAIIAAAFEDDAFVAERAAKLLPGIIQRNGVDDTTLQNIAAALADHPKQFQLVVEAADGNPRLSLVGGRSNSPFPSLVKLAKEWLSRGKPEQIRRAAVLLCRLAPTELDNRVGELVASEDRTIRLAGLRAATHSIETYRATNIEAAVSRWESRGGTSDSHGQPAATPWYVLPDAEAKPIGETQEDSQPQPEAPKSGAAAADSATQVQPTPQSKALEAAGRLFGDLVPMNTAPKASPTASQDSSVAGDRATASDGSHNGHDELELPSQWLQRWQNRDAKNRPKWLAACEASTQKLLASNDPEERAWALALWLMLGNTDHTDELHTGIGALAAKDAADAELTRLDLPSWLPADKRLAECQRRVSNLGSEGEKIAETLNQCTLIDDERVADWIFDQLNQASLSDPKLRASLAKVVLRSRIGGFSDSQFSTALTAEEYEYGAKPPYRIVRSKQTLPIAGRFEACDWLRRRYQSSVSDRQRAIALMAVAQLDHQTAIDAAIGAVQEAKADSEALQVALSIVLGDATKPGAQRATTMLSHAVPAVRSAALRLLTTPVFLTHDDGAALVPVVSDESVLPGFWRVAERFPTENLRKLATSDEEPQQSQAKLLLAAAGKHVDLAQLERSVAEPQRDYAKLCVAAALAKAGRVDPEAIEYYRQTYAKSDTDAHTQVARIPAALYEALRDLPGDEVAEFRRRMRQEKGAKILSNSGDGVFDSL